MKVQHPGDAWALILDTATKIASKNPQAKVTLVRDVYGRAWVGTEGPLPNSPDGIRDLEACEGVQPYISSPALRRLKELPETVRKIVVDDRRRTAGTPGNFWLLERLLSNAAWLRPGAPPPNIQSKVVSFYSFKGGVGRSTAAAMSALLLGRRGFSVLLIDLDLEAPGVEGFFGLPDDALPAAGMIDYLLEWSLTRGALQTSYSDYVAAVPDPDARANGGQIFIAPAGRLDGMYLAKLGRLNAPALSRPGDRKNPVAGFIKGIEAWRRFDFVLVDCRTGITDLGGLAINGLSDLDVLLFRAAPSGRRYLDVVLREMTRLVETSDDAEAIARSFLVVFSMAEVPSKQRSEEKFRSDLREFTRESVWQHVFERFSDRYSYPDDGAEDSLLEPVPHDYILLPYNREFARTTQASDMLRVQGGNTGPYAALVERILSTKLRAGDREEEPPQASRGSSRARALDEMARIVGKPAGEEEFKRLTDLTRKFLPREAYRSLFDKDTFLLLGRKGAGKSALFQALRHKEYVRRLAIHFGLDQGEVSATTFDIGFHAETGRRFAHVLPGIKSHERVASFWETFVAHRVAVVLGGNPRLADLTPAAIAKAGETGDLSQQAFGYLDETSATLARDDRRLVLAFDDLDTRLPRDLRAKLISGLVEFWQQNLRARPSLGCKIFLRTDLWNREVRLEDKSKLRDGIDRTDISWDGLDIYRLILKRLMGVDAVKAELERAGLWYASFDEADEVLGPIPPRDEAWVRASIESIAGTTMGSGASGHKRGYVYTWLQTHLSDASGTLHPRFALLAFSEAAKLQASTASSGPLLAPKSFVRALRGQVSVSAVEDLEAEYADWKADDQWIPRRFSEFERVWPIPRGRLEAMLSGGLGLKPSQGRDLIEHMVEAGLLDQRERSSGTTYQIPDIYLFGLGLTRRG